MEEPVVVRDPNGSSIKGGGLLVALFFGLIAYSLSGWLAALSVAVVSQVAVFLFVRYVISEREIALTPDGVITVTENGNSIQLLVDDISSIDGILDVRGGDSVCLHSPHPNGDLILDPTESSPLLEAVGVLLSAKGRLGIIAPNVAPLFVKH